MMIKKQTTNNKLFTLLLAASFLVLNVPLVSAQNTMQMSASSSSDADMNDMDFSGMDINAAEQPMKMKHSMTHGNSGMSMGSMQGGSVPVDARDPHAYSGGYSTDDVANIPRPVFADELNFSSLMIDRLEAVRSNDVSAAVYDAQAWFGRDYNRLVLKAEGDVDGGNVQESSTELLWGRALATFWDMQLGARYDSGTGPGKGWLAFGIQGLAPYWFDVEATAYASDKGYTALTLQAEYELLLTQKLVLQPRIETNLYGKSDAKRGVGAGLSDLSTGLRLRYEIRREFAPYIGVKWAGKFGGTANDARISGEPESDTMFVAGLRFWF